MTMRNVLRAITLCVLVALGAVGASAQNAGPFNLSSRTAA